MICPNCLEDYEFIKFDVDADTLEHRGIFRCGCTEELVFPEFYTREIIFEEDVKDRLRISRLMHLSRSLNKKAKRTVTVQPEVKRIQTRHLERYLEHISDRSLRLLKQKRIG